MESNTDTTQIKTRFWKPSVTSQFNVCPIPFHFDTYRGCQYGCLYCFARDFIQFNRRNKKGIESKQAFLEGNSPKGLERWAERALKSDYDYNKAEEVAFKERIPVKIGATADPFPPIERTTHITYDCLRVFDRYDYPVQISTKNPEVFIEYADEFINSNIALNVSCSFCDDDIAKKIEGGAIPPSRRFEAIKKLSEMGFRVTVRIQPFILPYSSDVAERFIRTLKDCGAWGFQTEGLKIRVLLQENERLLYEKVGEAFGLNIINDFKTKGARENGDRVYCEDDKRAMLARYTELSEKFGIKFFNADNLIDKAYGDGCECCGTEFLRNHKIWGGSSRARIMGYDENINSNELGKCIINFTHASHTKTYKPKTIKEVSDNYFKKEMERKVSNKLF